MRDSIKKMLLAFFSISLAQCTSADTYTMSSGICINPNSENIAVIFSTPDDQKRYSSVLLEFSNISSQTSIVRVRNNNNEHRLNVTIDGYDPNSHDHSRQYERLLSTLKKNPEKIKITEFEGLYEVADDDSDLGNESYYVTASTDQIRNLGAHTKASEWYLGFCPYPFGGVRNCFIRYTKNGLIVSYSIEESLLINWKQIVSEVNGRIDKMMCPVQTSK